MSSFNLWEPAIGALAVNKKTTAVVEKQACYGHVIEIIKDSLALERHMRLNKASFDAILFACESAYTNIVRAILGHDALYMTETPNLPRSPRCYWLRNRNRSESSKSLQQPQARTKRAHWNS